MSMENPFPVSKSLPGQKKAEKASSQIGRRGFLKAMGLAAAEMAISGCSSAETLENRSRDYLAELGDLRFTDKDLPRRDESEFVMENSAEFVQSILDQNLPIHFPLNEVFDIALNPSGIEAKPRVQDLDEFKALMQSHEIPFDPTKATFIRFKDGKAVNLDLCGEGYALHVSEVPGHLNVVDLQKRRKIVFGQSELEAKEKRTSYAVFVTEEQDPTPENPDGNLTTVKSYLQSEHFRLVKDDDAKEAKVTGVEGEPMNLKSTEGCLAFLRLADSTEMVRTVLALKMLRVNDLQSLNQFAEFVRLIPRDPRVWCSFLRGVMHYEALDRVAADEYRHPCETLRSGWGDCDDYTVMNFIWASLHQFDPVCIRVQNPSDGKGHVFVSYLLDEGLVVLDNDNAHVFEDKTTVEDYVKSKLAGFEIIERT